MCHDIDPPVAPIAAPHTKLVHSAYTARKVRQLNGELRGIAGIAFFLVAYS
jgi:hypothetical protein